LVVAQVVLAALIVLMGEPPWRAGWGWGLSVAGLVFGSWALVTMGSRQITAMPTPRAGAQLLRHGPYRYVRHPMYTSLILLTLGFVVVRPTPYLIAAQACLIVVLWLKSREEEKILREIFSGYSEYARTTKRFVPYVF
jgi:protein-S-isoprenylcysteine O-methyltransferase Ste14